MTSGDPSRAFALVLLLLAVAFDSCCTASILGDESPLQRRMASSLRSGHGAGRMFGAERPSRAEEFNRTGVLQPEYQIRATLNPNDVSQFYYLSPKSGSPPTLLVSPCSGPIAWSVSYVGPPETDQHAEGGRAGQQQSHWPVKQLVPSLPLFKYEGAETRNFTIPVTITNLYLIEMRPLQGSLHSLTDRPRGGGSLGGASATRSPNTVLMYATSDAAEHLPSSLIAPTRSKRHLPMLEFQQRWSRKRLVVSWGRSQHLQHHQSTDPDGSSSYLLAVTSSGELHPPTLCAAENSLRKHPCSPTGEQARHRHLQQQQQQQQRQPSNRVEPEGLHCVRRSRITLFGVKYNTTYHFTLYIMNTHNNVSSRVAMDSFRFERRPAIMLRSGRYASANLKRNDGFALFRYKPRDNATSLFSVLACGVCSIKLRIRAVDYCLEERISGEFRVRVPALPPGKRFSIQMTVSPPDLLKTSRVKILAVDDGASPYGDFVLQNSASAPLGLSNAPWEYRTFRKCRTKPASWCPVDALGHRRGQTGTGCNERRRLSITESRTLEKDY